MQPVLGIPLTEILPAYSPKLNPTEKTWRFLKTKKLNGSTVKDKEELRDEAKKMIKAELPLFLKIIDLFYVTYYTSMGFLACNVRFPKFHEAMGN